MNRVLWKSLVALAILIPIVIFGIFIYSFLPPHKPRSGEEIFYTFCKSCHLHGTTGAPQLGDKEDWSKRKLKGIEELTLHAMEGFHGMPPRGTCLNCREKEIKEAIEFMLGETG